jgi:hypothetical protein
MHMIRQLIRRRTALYEFEIDNFQNSCINTYGPVS